MPSHMFYRLYWMFVLTFGLLAAGAAAGDFWIPASDAAVVTNNDCGKISALRGKVTIHRSFHEEDAPGLIASATDHVNTGDLVQVEDGGWLEVVSGSNVAMAFGSGSRVRFSGLRVFAAGGVEGTRLDVELLGGEARVQVRLNRVRPESVMMSAAGADFLVRRGDVHIVNSGVWQGTVLSGEAGIRVRRGGTVGAPFALGEGVLLGAGGREDLGADVLENVRLRVPFSFEMTRAALPPLPSRAYDLEAP